MNIFLNPWHKERYANLLYRAELRLQQNIRAATAIYIMSANQELYDNFTSLYDLQKQRVKKEVLSSGKLGQQARILLRYAYAVSINYKGYKDDMEELLVQMDPENQKVAVYALMVRNVFQV